MKKYILPFLYFVFTLPAFSQFVHRSTLIGTGHIHLAQQGSDVAISADGTVAVVGAQGDSLAKGAAWVYTRNGNQWTQMGKKLLPNDAIYVANVGVYFGSAVAISADGNTIAIGGKGDNRDKGATWIFVRNGSRWVQQGTKLFGTQGTNVSSQGNSLALSADGNTLLVGGREDNGARGAVWYFQRNGTTWSQQGSKITVTPNNGWAFGESVSLSADGNTALIGAPNEGTPGNNQGYGYFYKRTGNTWNLIQKVTDLSLINTKFGEGVTLSGNGKVAVLGCPMANNQTGLLWVYKYNQATQQWNQEQMISPSGGIGGPRIGTRLSLSKGGDTLAAMGYFDNGLKGAVWTFTNINGTWSQLGTKITSPVTGGTDPWFGLSVNLNANGKILIIGQPRGGSPSGYAFIFSDSSYVMGTTKELQPELSLYPNPVKDFLYLPAGTSFSQLTVSDLSGKVILQQTTPTRRLDLSTFSAGIYIVSLQQKDKVRHVRIVKE